MRNLAEQPTDATRADLRPLSVDTFIAGLKRKYADRITGELVIPAREGRYAEFPPELDLRLVSALRKRGIERLYRHQREAWDLVAQGRPTVIVTPTASGKTLCFSLLTGSDAIEPHELLFLDTETTGLAGGTGTLPFLLGLARIDGDELHLCQWFLTGFRGEATLLEDACSWYGRARHLVSFNGKAFDVPLLTTRYRLARLAEPLSVIKHLDLLHPTRRAFGSRWPDCRLQTAERELLAFEREDDLPGYLVPEAWAAFVRSGAFTEVPRILHHNLLDLITLTGLLSTLVRVYAEPGFAESDTRAIARGFRQRGHDAIAYQYLCDRSDDLDAVGLMELADLHRQRRLWREAVQIWTRLAYQDHAMAMERLAKYYEHVRRDPRTALLWSSRLLQVQADNKQYQRRKARLLERINAVS